MPQKAVLKGRWSVLVSFAKDIFKYDSTVVNQCLQIFSFVQMGVVFEYFSGIALTYGPGSLESNAFKVGFQLSSFNLQVNAAQSMDDRSLTINFIPLIILGLLFHYRNKKSNK